MREDLRQIIRRLRTAELPWPLLLTGPAGCGKTCAGLALCDWTRGLYWVASVLCSTLIAADKGQVFEQGTGGSFELSGYGIWRSVREGRLLVLDELGGVGAGTDWHQRVVKDVLDAREHKPAVYMSNLDAGELARVYDDRIMSRLVCGTRFAFDADAPDRRANRAMAKAVSK